MSGPPAAVTRPGRRPRNITPILRRWPRTPPPAGAAGSVAAAVTEEKIFDDTDRALEWAEDRLTSTRSPASGTTQPWKSTTSPAAASGARRSWSSWRRTPAARSTRSAYAGQQRNGAVSWLGGHQRGPRHVRAPDLLDPDVVGLAPV